ncbi:MAG TPA: glycosyltransferase family 39 protein [Stellaceae bacterium]|nr:glycosyltransferase family 39 protein [Stellaceae bacterium]
MDRTAPAAAASVRLPVPRSYAGAALAAVLAITALRLIWLAVQPADLYPDEAQYWFWAQHPALGYYSKPPLLAWLIALTTGLFGNSEFAVRLSAPLLHAGAAFFVYAVAVRLYDARTGFWSALAYASLPGVSASAFIISTDAPLLLLWSAALYAFLRAREDGGRPWWLLVGVAVGLGLLAKYAMAYWVLSALAFVLSDRAERRHLAPLLAALGLAFAIYAPNLWWNGQHGFVSYLHTEDNADLTGPLFHPHALFQFLASQFAVFGPLFFAALMAMPAASRFLAEPRARLLAGFALPTLVIMLVLSFLSRAEANWAAPAYVSATVLVVRWMFASGWRRLLPLSVALHLGAALVAFGAPAALAALGRPLPAKYDILHRLRGWRILGREVGAVLARHPGLHLLADDREVLAALIYYVRPHPFDAAKWDGARLVKDQWDLTNDLSNYRGDSFLLVSEHDLAGEMQPSFASIEPIGALIVPIGPGAARHYTLYLARDFQGYRR